ncbi:hypothetical protein KIS1582_1714 [Cytobacillus firmus]|uniref:Uncharacterized protein n=1 Tax=Cytobacillus firmus TaxID=1399 RepID=A0A800NB54_CYTFI|nr:hypothetical protein KIS1582_1714 [Cytobacillus firmus]
MERKNMHRLIGLPDGEMVKASLTLGFHLAKFCKKYSGL